MDASLLAFLGAALIAALSYFALAIDPSTRRCAAEVKAWRASRQASILSLAKSQAIPVQHPAVPVTTTQPARGLDGGAVVLGLFCAFVLLVAIPMNISLIASAFEWLAGRPGRALGEYPVPLSAEYFVVRDTHFMAALLSSCLMIFGSAFMDARAKLAEGSGSRAWPTFLGVTLVFLVVFEVCVAALGGYFRSGDKSTEAWLVAINNGALALGTALAELVAGYYVIHQLLIGTVVSVVRRFRRFVVRKPRPAEVWVPDFARPSKMTRVLAPIDALLEPLRRLDNFCANALQNRRSRQGVQS